MDIQQKFDRLNKAANDVMNLVYGDERLSGMWSGDPLRMALERLEAFCDPDYEDAPPADQRGLFDGGVQS
jgi:hypothetical protein